MPNPVRVPSSLPVVTEMGRHASGRAWLARLPSLVEELEERWGVRLGEPYHGGSCSWVAPVERREGPAVLKVTWPHDEARAEAEALRLWHGHGAVEVYAHDAEHYALLLERCEPGTELGTAHDIPAEERLERGAEVLRRLWAVPVPEGCGVDPMTKVTTGWAGLAEERAVREWPPEVDRGLFALGADLLRDLPSGAPREVVVHGDFNPGNLLAARREPWLTIDAKPLVGDPAYDPWPLVEQVDDPFAHPDPAAVLRRRTALVADVSGADTGRLRAWAVARRVELALWTTVEDPDLTRSVRLLREARVLAEVAGL